MNPSLWRLAAMVAFASLFSAEATAQPKPVRIAMVRTFVRDTAASVVGIATNDFKNVLKKTTGLDGDLSTKFEVFEIADMLDRNQLDFGIFHGHEFAWVQKKHAELEPLLIAANKQHAERTYLIVHKNNPAKSVADLKRKRLDIPAVANEPGRAFLMKLTRDSAMEPPTKFFASIDKSLGTVKALDQVAFEKADAAIVDVFALEFYKAEKAPTFKTYLRVLAESEVFPPAVIVHKKGAVDAGTLKQFRDGLLKAHQTEDGREMMKDWNIDAFAPIPKDFQSSLDAIMKAYPSRGEW